MLTNTKNRGENAGADALVFAPGVHFGFAGEGDGVVAAAADVGEEFVGDVLHALFAHVPGERSERVFFRGNKALFSPPKN